MNPFHRAWGTRAACAAVTLAVLASVAGAPAATPVRAASGDTIKVTSTGGSSTIAAGGVGSTFVARVSSNTVTAMGGIQASVAFDNTKLQVNSIARVAGFWGSATQVDGVNAAAANTAGKLSGWAAFYFTTTGSATGTNVPFLDITFQVKSCPAGSAGSLTLPVGAADSNFLDATGNSITIAPADALAATVTCTTTVTLPTPSLGAQPAWRASKSIPLAWSATAGSNPVANYDVRYRRAAWNGTFGAYVTWLSATTTTSGTFTGAAGSTYCFSVRARDTAANVSAYTAERCTAVPLDDRSLTRSGTWTVSTSSSYYLNTYVRSTSTSAKLTRTSVQAKRIGLVATTCKTCGSVKVYLGSTLLKTVSLYSSTTVYKKLITVTTFTAVKTGTIYLKVGTSGKYTYVDGLIISRT